MQFVLGLDEMEASEEPYPVPLQAFVPHGALRAHQGRLYNDWAISLIGVERTLRDLSPQGLTKLTIVIPVYYEERSIPKFNQYRDFATLKRHSEMEDAIQEGERIE